jgi:hypothetical protein
LWALDDAGDIVTSREGDFALEFHDKAGAVSRIIRRDWRPLPITEADRGIIVVALDTLVQRSAEAAGRKLPALALAAMRRAIHIPDSYPPFVHLLTDDMHRFWMELPAHATAIARERPGQLATMNLGSGRWEVWDEAGHHLFDANFPPPFVLMDVRAGFVAGATVDGEGGRVVAVYKLGIT